MEFDIKEILKAGNLDPDMPGITIEGQTIYVYDRGMIYSYIHAGQLLRFNGTKKLTQKANYKLLSNINNDTPIGKHLIQDGVYMFDMVLSLNGIKEIQDNLPTYISYTKRQATQGFTILNTTSQMKRTATLRAHAANKDTD